jgi:hypothetical protein
VPAAPAWRRVQLRPDRRGGASSPELKPGGFCAAHLMSEMILMADVSSGLRRPGQPRRPPDWRCKDE